MKDPISNLIIQLKNGSAARKETAVLSHTNFVGAVVEALARKGFVKPGIKKGKNIQKLLEVGLIYTGGKSRITDVARISKPSKRIYKGYTELFAVKQGFGSTFLSTPKGVLSDDEGFGYSVEQI